MTDKVFEYPFATPEVITPDQAREYLLKNSSNRPPVPLNLRTLCRVIDGGGWILNGETIVFDWFGNLINGQHRLMACAHSGTPIASFVVRGIDPLAGITFDQQSKRSAGLIMGRHLAAVCAVVRNLKVNRFKNLGIMSYKWQPFELKNTLEAHPELVNFAKATCGLKFKGISSAVLGAAYWWFSSFNEDLADKFFTQLFTDAGHEPGSPVLTLRRFFSQFPKGSRPKQVVVGEALTKCWEAYIDGRPLTKLYLKSYQSEKSK